MSRRSEQRPDGSACPGDVRGGCDLVQEALLLLRPGFGARGWFDTACRVLHARPRLLLENGAPGTLIALARAGHGIAIVPSTHRFPRARVRVIPVLNGGGSLGLWMAANWDPRWFHAPYAERFVESLAAYARRHLNGAFRHAPPVPVPTDGGPGGKAGEPVTRSTKRRATIRAQ